MSVSPDYDIFDAGNVTLQSGTVFPGMQLAYKTYGHLNADKSNAILYPTSFAAQHTDTEWLIEPGAALDPDRYFIIIANLIGNGLSSSPSNTAFAGQDYPNVTYHDAIAVQHRLVTEHFGISRLAMVYGWSMGGMQTYHWAARYPDMVERAAVVCGSARCSPFNAVFLESVRAALTADPAFAFADGRFTSRPAAGLRAMGRVYAGWAMSHGFYRDELWREGGFTSLEDYLSRSWDLAFAHRDANNILAQLWTWQNGDISRCAEFGGDFTKAMAAIKAPVLLMPGATDDYFQVGDNEAELPLLTHARSAELCPIPSLHGHRAGNPIKITADKAFLNAKIKAFLGS